MSETVFKIGDVVKVVAKRSAESKRLDQHIYLVKNNSQFATHPETNEQTRIYQLDNGEPVWDDEVVGVGASFKPEGVHMFKTVGTDLKAFIAENKSIIYWVATMFLMDHLLFQGAFRERLHGLMNKMLGKAEAAIDKDTTLSVVEKKA